jgi:hypothetical protein
MASFTTLKDFAAVRAVPEGMLPYLYPQNYDICTLEEYKEWLKTDFKRYILHALFLGRALYDRQIRQAGIPLGDITQAVLAQINAGDKANLSAAFDILNSLAEFDIDYDLVESCNELYDEGRHVSEEQLQHGVKNILSQPLTPESHRKLGSFMRILVAEHITRANSLADVRGTKRCFF